MTDDEMRALREMFIDVLRAEIANAIPVMVRAMFEEADRRQRAQLPEGLTALDRELARVVGRIYRDQGRKPAKTLAVSMSVGYSPSHTLTLLKAAEEAGAVASVPGRGDRHSGLWLPADRAA
jgi:hypothetical protein